MLSLRALADPGRAATLSRFFQTHPGGYGAGDRFLGITVPRVRAAAREHRGASLAEATRLVRSGFHEERLLGLFLLVGLFRRGNSRERRRVYAAYVRHLPHINNWDLVDASAEHIVGATHFGRGSGPLLRWVRSGSVWGRRVAIVSTFYAIRRGRFVETFAVADLLLADPHDLVRKAVGWMLREVGKRDAGALRRFLAKRYHRMPRTMLRYAIERFPERRRRAYLRGTV